MSVHTVVGGCFTIQVSSNEMSSVAAKLYWRSRCGQSAGIMIQWHDCPQPMAAEINWALGNQKGAYFARRWHVPLNLLHILKVHALSVTQTSQTDEAILTKCRSAKQATSKFIHPTSCLNRSNGEKFPSCKILDYTAGHQNLKKTYKLCFAEHNSFQTWESCQYLQQSASNRRFLQWECRSNNQQANTWRLAQRYRHRVTRYCVAPYIWAADPKQDHLRTGTTLVVAGDVGAQKNIASLAVHVSNCESSNLG